ncbi:hypothetical protein Pint_17746 [Pistacia integerrima]|uniref:Uncharacterized protein n=1 Tax=Pistacia integerrima TaxID=434235 RepID=A0ACC0YTL7_9ROSI|nr:hypothetical protein Pint_17746 [Pistacia integerrima]
MTIVMMKWPFASYYMLEVKHNIGSCMQVYELEVEGVIPDEIWSLNFLTNLNVERNLLSGPLSPSVSNLTAIKYLNIGNYILEDVGTNNFSGRVPPELGNLKKLKKFSGVSGEIPSSFANLQNLVQLWASNIEFTGRIPNFIGNWSNLETLRFQGNSFEGPIPSSFSKLTKLTELRISDLAFLTNMKKLTYLELRNNRISDSIPSNIGDYQGLVHLDLSFNNLRGQIPGSLFSLTSLTHLFLGNNKLNGTLPAEKSQHLLNIDVSYNNLVGRLPSWISHENLQLNLVANNFNLDSSNSSALPHGLNCLQRNFPCNRGSPIYSSYAVKCGGQELTSYNSIVYESDDENLGPATYYVTADRWRVSNIGYFTGSENPRYKSSYTSEVTNTQDSELFQTARISVSSLRYYGLGLENGNYTVTLQFAEIDDFDTTGWKSLARHVFDIYVQDFDIISVVPRRAFQREYKAQVSENYLEIHLFCTGKRTRCIPDQGTYGPSIWAISATQAWHLYENNRHLELVDSKLSKFSEEEVKCLIALLCTQTLPSSRPPMPRVVAMLCGDIEVSTVTSKPVYLTAWTFDDVATSVSDAWTTEECDDISHYISSTSSSTVDKNSINK